MRPDLGIIIGLIGVVSAVGVLGQRVMLLEQARGASSPERRLDAARLKPHNTPA